MSKCGSCKKDKENMRSPTICVDCAARRKEYYTNNSTKIKENAKQWRSENTSKVKKYRKNWIAENKDKVKTYNKTQKSSTKGRYRRAIERASIRGIEFTLSFETYERVISTNCIYCNGSFGSVKWGVGLDRINNSVGYVEGNVVSCCKLCNQLKSDWLTFEETKAAVDAILKVRGTQTDKLTEP